MRSVASRLSIVSLLLTKVSFAETAAERVLARNMDQVGGLGPWRLVNDDIVTPLKEFASGKDWPLTDSPKEHLNEVLHLFNRLNNAMWQQEDQKKLWIDVKSSTKPGQYEIPVVFGGKLAQGSTPLSISEKMISLLASNAEKVYTVSRSSVTSISNVQHIPKSSLAKEGGNYQFQDVMTHVLSEGKEGKIFTFYFTLGEHRAEVEGDEPFKNNVLSAKNFAQALMDSFSNNDLPFRVVLTGTDATKESKSADYTVIFGSQPISVFSYKIWKNNFIYAMSKLYQFYVIADAVQKLTGTYVPVDLATPIRKMENLIQSNWQYVESNPDFTMEELDDISKDWDIIEAHLKDYLMVARGISICYTPLHAKPWTREAFVTGKNEQTEGSPKGYIIQSIVSRLKNAISIDYAARSHFEWHSVEKRSLRAE